MSKIAHIKRGKQYWKTNFMTKWRKVKKIVKSKEIFDLNLIIQTQSMPYFQRNN